MTVTYFAAAIGYIVLFAIILLLIYIASLWVKHEILPYITNPILYKYKKYLQRRHSINICIVNEYIKKS